MTSGLKWNGSIPKGKDKGEINKKGKYKQEKREQVTRAKISK